MIRPLGHEDTVRARLARDRGRESVFVTAQLRVRGSDATMTVRVRNLSEGGLMAELPMPIAHDALVEVEVRGLGWVSGRVAWQTAGRTGIAFDQLVDPRLARSHVTPLR